ncbi:MAG: lytic transglycosylase domain-containing protein [Desulfosarcina sp.]|jgi:soluble lytic murein transglycosylase-like protein
MNTTTHTNHIYEYLRDVAVFVTTIFICSFVLSGAYSLKQATATLSTLPPVLALPQMPAPIHLVPERHMALSETEANPAFWDIDLAPAYPDSQATPAIAEPHSIVASVGDNVHLNESIPFYAIIVKAAGRYEVDPHLIRAIILAESGYNPKAKSKKGARGLMQLMPSTAKALGVGDIWDPEENIDGGVRYFRSLLDRFDGDVQLALAAYNAGSRHVRNYEGIPPFKATQHYIKKVLKFHKKFKKETLPGYRRLA